jgi:hypothetical protein
MIQKLDMLVPIASKRDGKRLPLRLVVETTRCTNRPSFRQIIGFDSHGPR